MKIICLFSLLALLCRAMAEMLHIHAIPHSHQDPGWKRTVDQYYEEDIKYVFETVIDSLVKDSNRTFVEVEMSFFERWWKVQTLPVRQTVRSLVKNKQLEFINGGWVMADNACPTIDEQIRQIAYGHKFLKDEFNYRPKYAWSIDPFGHSASFATAFADMGYEAFVINRMDYRVKQNWMQNGKMEFIWRGQHSRGNEADIFTHVLDHHYMAPWGFNFEWGSVGHYNGYDAVRDNPPVIDVPPSEFTPANVQQRSDELVSMLKERREYFRTNHLLVPFGNDFTFRHAHQQYENIDKVIRYISAHSAEYNVTIAYSTLEKYFHAVHDTEQSFPVYDGDLYPYRFAPSGARYDLPGMQSDNEIWSGYYTTLPAFKKRIRDAQDSLATAERFVALTGANPDLVTSLEMPRRVTSLSMHHDTITGTSTADVIYDMTKRLEGSIKMSDMVIGSSIAKLINPYESPRLSADLQDLSNDQCSDKVHYVVFSNPLARQRREIITIPFSCEHAGVSMKTESGDVKVTSQVDPNPFAIHRNRKYKLHILVDLPALGYSIIKIQPSNGPIEQIAASSGKLETIGMLSPDSKELEDDAIISTTYMSLTVSRKTGLLKEMFSNWKEGKHSVVLNQDWISYEPYINDWPKSDNYRFRPAKETPNALLTDTPTLQVIDGPLVKTIIQDMSSRNNLASIKQSSSIYEFEPLAGEEDMLFVVDVLPTIEITRSNQEIVTRFNTNMNNTMPKPAWVNYNSQGNVQQEDRRNLLRAGMKGRINPDSDLTNLNEKIIADAKAQRREGRTKKMGREGRRASQEGFPEPIMEETPKEVLRRRMGQNEKNGEQYWGIYTDTNGQEIRERTSNHPYWEQFTFPDWYIQQTSLNYYPITSFGGIKQPSTNEQLAIVVDRPHGIASQAPKQLDVMMQRQIEGGWMSDVENATPLLRLIHGESKTVAKAQRLGFERVRYPIAIHLSDRPLNPHQHSHSLLRQPLPQGLQLMSLDVVQRDHRSVRIVMRVSNIFAKNEHPDFSGEVTTRLGDLFYGLSVLDLYEISLAGSTNVEDVNKLSFKAEDGTSTPSRLSPKLNGSKLTLKPLETAAVVLVIRC